MKILEGEKGKVPRGSATEEIGEWAWENRKRERGGKGKEGEKEDDIDQ